MGHIRQIAIFCIIVLLNAIAITPAAAEGELKVFNYEILGDAFRVKEPAELKPIRIVGARNGSFSGCVALSSTADITGLKGEMGSLSMGGTAIPSEKAAVRYAVSWTNDRRAPGGLDILLESPPEKVAKGKTRALAGVWVTVDVPENTAPGLYKGDLTVKADGLEPQTVAVELEVVDWSAPDSDDWKTWTEVIQSPDTLSLEYNVPLWSDEHWDMIARSFKLIRETGSRVVYIPLLRNTNQGNAESMVRWIKEDDGSLTPDYTIMEKYLDLAQKNLGDLKLVVFYVWDSYLVMKFRNENFTERPVIPEKASKYAKEQIRVRQKAWDMRQKGLQVTMLDKATGKTEDGHLPLWLDPKSKEIWKPVFDEIRTRMKKRGLEDKLALGMVCDMQPLKEEIEFFKEVTGDIGWIAHSHYKRMNKKPYPNTILYNVAGIKYEAHAYNLTYHVNPALKPIHGWRTPELSAYIDRFGLLNGSSLRVRQMPQLNITGNQRGVGRCGGDMWRAIKDKRGRRSGQAFARYPWNFWRGLNVSNWLLAPGKKSAVATSRMENFREGLLECEARILLENALIDQPDKLGDELAKEARAVLDEHQLVLWESYWSNKEQLDKLGAISGRSIYEALWGGLSKAGVKMPGFWDGSARKMRSEEGAKGLDRYVASDWKGLNKRLFTIAGKAQAKLK